MDWLNIGEIGKAGWAWLRPWAVEASRTPNGDKLDAVLWSAARDGNFDLAQRVLVAGANPSTPGWRGRDALNAALSELRGDAGEFVQLLGPRVDLGWKDEDGRSSLIASMGSGASARTLPLSDGVEACWTVGFWTLLPMIPPERTDLLSDGLIRAANVGWPKAMEAIGDRLDWRRARSEPNAHIALACLGAALPSALARLARQGRVPQETWAAALAALDGAALPFSRWGISSGDARSALLSAKEHSELADSNGLPPGQEGPASQRL